MSDNSLIIKLGIEDANATKKIKELQAELKTMDKQMDALDTSTENFNTNMTNIGKKIDLAKTKISALEEELKQYATRQREANTRLTEAKQKYEQLANSSGASKTEIANANKEVQNAQTHYNNMTRKVAETNAEIQKVTNEISKMSAEMRQMPFENLSQKLDKASSAFSTMAKLSAPLATAFAGLFTAGITQATEFEYAMKKVQAVSGATQEEFEQLSEKARELGGATEYSAVEVSDAFYYMSLAGWDVQESLDGVAPLLDLATASTESLATVSDILTDNLGSFNMTAQDTGKACDILASASSNSNTTVEMLGQSFKSVAPVAGAMGYTMQDTALMLGLMANAGIKAESAGTQLRTTLANLANPTKAVSNAMSEYNVSLTNADGTMKTLKDVVSDLRTAFSGLDEAQKAELASTLAGKEGMSGLLVIVNSSDEDFNSLADSIYNCEGATAQMAETMRDSTQGDIDELKSKMQELAISIGEKLLPYFVEAMEKISDLLDWFSNLNDETQDSIIQFGLFSIAFSSITGVLSKVTGGLSSVCTSLGEFAKKSEITGEAVSTFGRVVNGALSFDGVAVVAGGVLIGGALYALYKGFETVYTVSKNSEGILTNAQMINLIDTTEAQSNLKSLQDTFEELWNVSEQTLSGVIQNGTALSKELMEEQLQTYKQGHERALAQIETFRTSSKEIIDLKYAEELAIAQTKSDEEVAIVQEKVQLEKDAIDRYWNERILKENQGYEQVINDTIQGNSQVNAQNELFHEQAINNLNNYMANQEAIYLGNSGRVYAIQEEEQLKLNQMLANYSQMNLTQQQEYVGTLDEQMKIFYQAQLDSAEQHYTDRLAEIEKYSAEELALNGTSHKELAEQALQAYNAEKESAGIQYQELLAMRDNYSQQAQERLNFAIMAEQEARLQGYNIQQQDVSTFYEIVQGLYEQGHTDINEVVNTAMGQLQGDLQGEYSDMEGDLTDHGSRQTSIMKGNMDDLNTEAQIGVDGVNEKIETLQDHEQEVKTTFTEEGYSGVWGKLQSIMGAVSKASAKVTSIVTGAGASLFRSDENAFPSDMEYRFSTDDYSFPEASMFNYELEYASISPYASAYGGTSDIINSTAVGAYASGGSLTRNNDYNLDNILKLLQQISDGQTLNGGEFSINIENLNVRSEQDIKRIARELEELRKMELKGRGE